MSAQTSVLKTHRYARRGSGAVGGAIAILAAIVTSIAVACGDDGNAADAPTPTPAAEDLPATEPKPLGGDEDPPPALTVTAGEVSIEAGLGSYCWSGLCADKMGPITPVEPLPGAGVESLGGELASESMAEVFVDARPVTDLESAPEDDSSLVWGGMDAESVSLPSTAEAGSVDVDISDLQPGQYLVTIFVRFQGGGDAMYGILLDAGQ